MGRSGYEATHSMYAYIKKNSDCKAATSCIYCILCVVQSKFHLLLKIRYTQHESTIHTVHIRDINNGVYRAGFATKQEAYDKAVREVFAALDRVEEILSRQRYLTGSTLTEADVRLFTTLVRFDCVYVGHFKVGSTTKFLWPRPHALPGFQCKALKAGRAWGRG